MTLPATSPEGRRPLHRDPVALWMGAIVVLVTTMVALGGITRLAGAGLSIVEWAPVSGVLPPLDADGWGRALDAYRASPEGRLINTAIDMGRFQRIFLIEWAHRLVGRVTGAVMLVPLLVFWARGALSPATRRRMTLVALLGGAQGAIGWLMVHSGLIDKPHVSPIRLALHLLMAFALMGLVLWALLDHAGAPRSQASPGARSLLALVGGCVVITVASGAAMAGTRAGWHYPTFPTMNGAWVPDGIFPRGLIDVVEHQPTVHFTHRLLATAVAVAAVALLVATRSASPLVASHARLVALAVLVQISLGAATVLLHVPVAVAVAHQLGGLLVFSAVVVASRACWGPSAVARLGSRDPSPPHQRDEAAATPEESEPGRLMT